MVASVHEGQAIFATWDTWKIGSNNSLLVFASPVQKHWLQGVPEDALDIWTNDPLLGISLYINIDIYQ